MKSLVRILACVAGLYATVSAQIVMTPYLQAVTTTGIHVAVECKTTSSVTVSYGTTAAYGNTAITSASALTTQGTYVHDVVIGGLQPNTLYHYMAQQGGSTSSDATFTTAPLPGTPFRFAWLADNRGGGSLYDGIIKRIQAANPSIILHGGDIASNGSYSYIKADFFTPTALSLYSRVPFVLAIGNHELWSQNPMAFVERPLAPSGAKDEYYSFDYGDMHVVVMMVFTSSGATYDTQIGSPQYKFIENDLKASTKPWKIVIAHKVPYYSEVPHPDGAPELIPLATNVFEKYGVSMMFGGHSHLFQHNLVNGIHYMVIGSSGAELYDPITTKPFTLKSVKDYCYGIADVSSTQFKLTVYNGGGAVLDNVVLSPGALAVSLFSFIARPSANDVRLEWSTSSEINNYGFFVQKSSSPSGPFADASPLIPGHGTALNENYYAFTDQAPASWYRLKEVSTDGSVHYSDVVAVTTTSVPAGTTPTMTTLYQNYPNPFNPSTQIVYTLGSDEFVTLTLVNTLGQTVRTLVKERQAAGSHTVSLSADAGLSGGMYFYRLETSRSSHIMKMVLLK